jgi:hypothetical protein
VQRPGGLLPLAVVGSGLAACGGDAARISLAPVEVPGSTCGRPADARSLKVTAQGEFLEDVRSIELGAPVDIADFPPGTRQLAVEVLGAGGVVAAFGRTAPFELTALADGDVVPIFMAPPDGGCPVGDLAEARDRPLVIAAGDGALVLGGRGGAGFLGTAEWYDPATGGFEPVATPQAYAGEFGATGVAAATLPDGRVVLVGGHRPIYTVFDPADRSFTTPGGLFEVRAHHAAVALDDDRLLLAGGCGQLQDVGVDRGECLVGATQARTVVLDLRDGALVDGPVLAIERIRPAALREADRVVVIGGHDDAGAPVEAERLDLGGDTGTVIPGAGGAAAVLASGSAVAAFAGEGATASGTVAVVVPGVDAARGQGTVAPRAGPVLVPLEDGDVLVVGGRDDVPVARYRPGTGAVIAAPVDPVDLAGAPIGRAGHGAARLPDGSVLVVGGRDAGGAPLAGAWVYRPDGDTPYTGAVSVTPAADSDVPLVPLDPARVSLAPAYRLDGGLVVIAGMTPRAFDLGATLAIEGGAAVILGFADPTHHDAIELPAGGTARLVRRDGAAPAELCRGGALPDDLAGGVALAVSLRGEALEVRVDGEVVLACDLAEPRAGLVGVAALDDAARVTLSTVSVTR